MKTAPLATALTHLRKEADRRSDRQLLDAYRFANDQGAFTALVQRHGPMVLGVCRRVLQDTHDAEDAFQAVFLALARGASSIRNGEGLTSWLHGVSSRTALRARRDAARRRKHEGQATPRANPPAWEVGWRELQVVLDEEVQRLSAACRAAFVLCCLEGLSLAEAAERLGIKENTVSSRLGRSRQRLRERLARRGISLTPVLAALAVSNAGRAAVPARLVRTIAAAASRLGAGAPVTGLSTRTISLAEGVNAPMLSNKLKLAVLLWGLSVLATGLGVLARPAPEEPASQAVQTPPRTPTKKDKTIAVRGRVLGADGRPVPGAKVHLTPAIVYGNRRSSSPANATTGPDGHFAFTVPQAKFADQFLFVAATAPNHGVGWVTVSPAATREDVTLRLVKDDVPITGQIVDLEGKPVAAATLTVLVISAAPGEDLGPWLKAARARPFPKGSTHSLRPYNIPLSPKVTTDAEGRFRLSGIGIGRDRLIRAQLDGPAIASQYLHFRTRPGKTLEVTEYEGQPRGTTYYAATFRHAAAPSRPIAGVVRDKDTRKPLAGVTIQSNKLANDPIPGRDIVQTTTDAQGRYRLTGMPKGAGNKIRLVPRHDQPYVSVHAEVPDSPGLGPVTVDFALKRGVWIEGTITDKGTGKPVQGYVDYFALVTNPNLRDHPGFHGTTPPYGGVGTKQDGSYRVVGLPGPGLIVVYRTDHHLRASERDDEFAIEQLTLFTSPYQLALPISYSAIARINPGKGGGSVKRDVTLDPGWTFKGTVLGPDGKPLAGARGFGLAEKGGWDRAPMRTARFTGRAFNPRGPRAVLFRHSEKGLVGVAQPPKENGGSVMVRLERGAAVTGRLVDTDGKPLAEVEWELTFRPKKEPHRYSYSPASIKTDGEGRFRIVALLPGSEFRLSGRKGELRFGDLRAGQMRDLGDVVVKPIK